MPLAKEVDEKIRAALGRLGSECQRLADEFQRCSDAPELEVPIPRSPEDEYFLNPAQTRTVSNPLWQLDVGQFEKARQTALTVIELIGGGRPPLGAMAKQVAGLSADLRGAKSLRGIAESVKENYEHGLFEPIVTQIERAIAGDYLGQAEQLLDEGVRGKSDHVPAAVLLGAVFEKKIRTLCAAQVPPIEVMRSDGQPKKVIVLIDELKATGAYGETKAKELRWIASIRNHAAHGEFDKFTRADVEKMRTAVGQFVEGF